MRCTLTFSEGAACLSLDGPFTFEGRNEFRRATQELPAREGLTGLAIDLSAVPYMDSAALGMILLLQEKLSPAGARIALVRPTPAVLNILKVVQFDTLFEIR